MKIVGKALPRAEGLEKVSGRAVYAADVKLPGLLWGKILRSPHPHALIRRVDAERAKRVAGVRVVLTGRDVAGRLVGKLIRDMPILCWERVRFVGDRVAAVAAESPEAAEEALALIEVEYEELPAVFDPLAAIRPDAPRIHENVAAYDGAPKERLALDVPNGLTRLLWRKGDVEEGFRRAELVLEHSFRIPGRHQGYLEPHAGVVAVDGEGRVRVWASTKQPFGTRSQLAKAVGVPEEEICFCPVNVGGEFGGKGDAGDLPVGRPVKVVMSCAEELAASNPAHPTVVTVKSGVSRDGRILARELSAIHASGAYGALKANASLAVWHFAGWLYRVESARTEFLQVYTNTVPGGYFRAPGGVQTCFAIESHTDLLAAALGMDPAEFRLRNLLREGEEDAIGQRLQRVHFREVLEAALEAAGWRRRGRRPGRGRGLALFGRHIGGGDAGLVLAAERDGTVSVISAVPDQGAGTHTVLRQIVAEEMGIPVERVRAGAGDTATVPRDSGARASRVTYVAGRAAIAAAAKLRAELLERAARILECAPEEVGYGDGAFFFRGDPGQRASLARVASEAGGSVRVAVREDFPQPDEVTYVCAQVAEVEVDRETGAVRLVRLITAHDTGAVINPITHQGQIEGGAVMGIGQGLMEELVLEDGRVINASLADYKMPTVADLPRLETVLVRSSDGVGPYGAKAIGEFANNSPPAAIANAVADAVGVRLYELPITAEKIHRALQGR
jgi:CO/xanthine dehydrogenase Mo-binding subunit